MSKQTTFIVILLFMVDVRPEKPPLKSEVARQRRDGLAHRNASLRAARIS